MEEMPKPSKQISNRAKSLREEIRHHRYLYHVLDTQEISDAALDSLKRELEEIEREYPGLVTADSPTQRVGGEPREEFTKVDRGEERRMTSLTDAFNEEDVRAWFTRLRNALGEGSLVPELYCDLKMDGLAIELEYDADGLLRRASTRGSGVVGEDVTENVKTIEAIPLRLQKKPRGDGLFARGEIFLPKKEFARINKALQRAGEKTYANPRNVAAGAIRQLDSRVTASRKLSFYAYGLWGEGDEYFEKYPTHAAEYAALRDYGIPTNPKGVVVQSLEEAVAFHARIEGGREKLQYDIDGTVISINSNAQYKKAGVVGKAPRGAVAYKFAPEEGTTVVKDIRIQVGRTGALTPVAVLEPVFVGGTTVQHATLHNADEITRLGVRIGDTVIVSRAGDVIPKITKVLMNLRPSRTKVFIFPTSCPVCGTTVTRDDEGVVMRCPNTECPTRHRRGLYHFASRPALDIEGLGPERIDLLVDAGLVTDPADFFTLRVQDVASLERMGDISAKKLLRAIEERKKPALARFLFALGIAQIGEETASDLVDHFGSLEAIAASSKEELERVEGIGSVVSQSVVSWFADKENKVLLKKFTKAGVVFVSPKKSRAPQTLAGNVYVLTGNLTAMTRAQAKEAIKARGGRVSSAVSKKTSAVIVGGNPGSKLAAAEKLGVSVLDEAAFLALLGRA